MCSSSHKILDLLLPKPSVNFTSILCAAFTLVDPESVKNTVRSSISFYDFRNCTCKSSTQNIDKIEPRPLIKFNNLKQISHSNAFLGIFKFEFLSLIFIFSEQTKLCLQKKRKVSFLRFFFHFCNNNKNLIKP